MITNARAAGAQTALTLSRFAEEFEAYPKHREFEIIYAGGAVKSSYASRNRIVSSIAIEPVAAIEVTE